MTRQPDASACPLVAIIIVSWNGWADTHDLLMSLRHLEYPHYEVVVIDNASTDGSSARLRTAWPEVHVLQCLRNHGFAGGVNLGLRFAITRGAAYAWLLNNDTTVVPEALTELVTVAEQVPGTFYGSWIVDHNDPDRIWFGGGSFGRWSGRIAADLEGTRLGKAPERGGVHTTAWITGCSLLVRSAALERLGHLREDYFLYMEELEWQLRRPQSICHILSKPLVCHKIGRSTGGVGSTLHTIFMSRNFLKLMSGHAGIATPIWCLRWLCQYVLYPLAGRRWMALRAGVRGAFLIRVSGEEIVARCLATSPLTEPDVS